MAMQQHIRNPIEWGWDSLKNTGRALNSAGHTDRRRLGRPRPYGAQGAPHRARPISGRCCARASRISAPIAPT